MRNIAVNQEGKIKTVSYVGFHENSLSTLLIQVLVA